MNTIDRTIRDRDAYVDILAAELTDAAANERLPSGLLLYVDNLAAELTDAAYPVALRHGVAGSSIDLELDLWKAIAEKLRRKAYPSLSK